MAEPSETHSRDFPNSVSTAVVLTLVGISIAAQHAIGAATSNASPGPMIMYEGATEMEMLPIDGKSPTWADVSKVYTTIHTAEKATFQYRDVRVAERHGYYTEPILYVPSQGAHYANQAYMREADAGHIDLLHPPFLVYNKVNGTLTLSGLMYLAPAAYSPAQLARIFPASMAVWHRHINTCIAPGPSGSPADGKVLPIYTEAACRAKGGYFSATTGWMVHVWIGQVDGTGLFDMDRNQPEVSACMHM